ncbi:hypothetical protein [Vibrio sp. SCSIO 43136]|uniref:hypothetical protein n=1 Tax=Vibrio sp. SCSIO 43136 TaxID=2819101 RepID=UPI002075ACAE|nr:hypothetical protein [Vibrio sp. SCSIO 43136]USD68124.1 hypothetical protein J4N39_18290 [Vibrio sp. SCSIO 43136]
MIERKHEAEFQWNGGQMEITVTGAGSAKLQAKTPAGDWVIVTTSKGDEIRAGRMAGSFDGQEHYRFSITGAAKVFTNR